jgi:predicted O-methyltransferase YrrM
MEQPVPHITTIATSVASSLPEIVRAAFENALAGHGKMDERVYAVDGFCGRKQRLFLNNLIATMPDPRYLEIGIFRGATLCAAISNNKVHATGVDNWSEYGGKATEFYINLAAFKGPDAKVTVIEQDFRTVNYAALGSFNVGFYDGPHQAKDQYDGARLIVEALEPQAVLLIDDWNWPDVRTGTMNALHDTGAHIDFAVDLRTTLDGSFPTWSGIVSDWHNGMFVAALSRRGGGHR